MPTVLDYMELPIPAESQGEPLRPLLTGVGKWDPKPLYFGSMALTLNFNWASPRGLYLDEYKYIELPLPELYDIEADFEENENLWEAKPEVAAALEKRLHDLLAERTEDGATTIQPQSVDEETLEKLRALGYVSGSHSASISPDSNFSEEDDPKRLIHFINQLDDAGTLFRLGQHHEAIERYQELIEWRPDFALAYAYLAYIYKELDRLTEAIGVLETAFGEGVRNDMVLVRLGTYLQLAGDLERSEAILKLAVESYPDHMEARNPLGLTFFYQGRTTEAIQVFEDLLRKDPSLVSAHNNLGSVYLGQRRYEPALAQFERALDFDGDAAEALNGMGVVYASTGRLEEAVEAWKKAVALDPRLYDTLYNLGIL